MLAVAVADPTLDPRLRARAGVQQVGVAGAASSPEKGRFLGCGSSECRVVERNAFGCLLPDCFPKPHVRCYLTSVRTTISTKGQIVIPAELREADRIRPGEEFEVDRIGPDVYRLTRVTPPPNQGVVEWLRSCPEQGWFVQIESESTDSL